MIEQSDLKSGFDIELLMTEEYIRYLLLCSVDSGDLATTLTFPMAIGNVTLTLRVPEDIRRDYTVNPSAAPLTTSTQDTFAVKIIDGRDDGADLQLTFRVNVLVQDASGATLFSLTDIDLVAFAEFSVNETRDEDTELLTAVDLHFEVLEMESDDSTLGPYLETNQVSVLTQINAVLTNGFSAGGLLGSADTLQTVQMQKFTNDPDHRVIGLYLNALVKNSFHSYEPDRGVLGHAINFLPEGQHFAFGINQNFFDILATSFKYLIADQLNGDEDTLSLQYNGETIGSLSDVELKVVTSTYETPPRGHSERLTALRMKATIITKLYESDLIITVDFFPLLEDGLITWKMETDVNLDIIFEAIPFMLIFLVGMFNPIAGVIFGAILMGGLAFAEEAVIEPMLEREMSGSLQDQANAAASFLSLIPQRIDLAKKRWDPFYNTKHQVLVPFDYFELADDGLVACGQVKLSRQFEAPSHTIIRDETRTGDQIERLKYRIKDYSTYTALYSQTFPATDRETFTLDTTDAETGILTLDSRQLQTRLDAGKIKQYIRYVPKKIQITDHEVAQILSISETELAEGEASLIDTYTDEERQAIMDERGDELTAQATEELTETLGHEPTADEIEEYIDTIIKDEWDEAIEARKDADLETDLTAYVQSHLRFDLSPQELARLQEAKALYIVGYDLVHRLSTKYYRDDADHSLENNLMSLPKY